MKIKRSFTERNFHFPLYQDKEGWHHQGKDLNGIYQAETLEEIEDVLDYIKFKSTADWGLALGETFNFINHDRNLPLKKCFIDDSTAEIKFLVENTSGASWKRTSSDIHIPLSGIFVETDFDRNEFVGVRFFWNHDGSQATSENHDNVLRISF